MQQNIEHYRAMLKVTTDLERRGVIEKLLLEEEAKLRKYDDEHKTKWCLCGGGIGQVG